MSVRGLGFRLFAVVGAAFTFASANAQNLSWHFDQIYSNFDGFLQYMVLTEYGNNQNQNTLQGNALETTFNDPEHAHEPGYVVRFTFPSNLPSSNTAGKKLLIATQGFADLGIVTPDYIVENQFVAQKSGLLNFFRTPSQVFDIVSYKVLPSDGVNALYRNDGVQQAVATNFAGQSATVPQTPPANAIGTAVEYYYAAWNYYFETAFPDEIALLDSGGFGGNWKRTGETFKVWTKGSASTPGACRFFSTSFAPKSSHFYTPFTTECQTVKTNPNWQYEAVAFYAGLADVNGNCGPGTAPLYRLYNNGQGGAPNHRYTTNMNVFNQMVAAGWIFEGNGNTKVFACIPA